eukprot:gene11000-7643_t
MKKKAAWVDADDVPAEQLPSFYTKQHVTPSWAISDAAAEWRRDHPEEEDGETRPPVASRKRFRHEDLDRLLSQTAPLLTSRGAAATRTAPKTVSTVALPKDTARSVQWHPSGQLLLVGGNKHVYLFHASGKYVEQLAKVDVQQGSATTLKSAVLSSSGDEALLTGHEAYVPVRVSLHTEQLTPLRFLDTRDTAIYRSSAAETPKAMRYISRIVAQSSAAPQQLIAVAAGNTVRLASLASGCVTGTVIANDLVSDVQFFGERHLYISSGNRVLLYDIRMGSRYVKEHVDEGALQITRFAVSSRYLAIGSSSGVVSLYHRTEESESNDRSSTGGSNARPAPLKNFSQLTTGIDGVAFGAGADQMPALAFFTGSQKAAFRLAHLPEGTVVPSFPAVSTRHDFIHSLAFAPGLPILSVGERQRVVNYAF